MSTTSGIQQRNKNLFTYGVEEGTEVLTRGIEGLSNGIKAVKSPSVGIEMASKYRRHCNYK
jgi:hypothetical protein